jgi:hypothetical protein
VSRILDLTSEFFSISRWIGYSRRHLKPECSLDVVECFSLFGICEIVTRFFFSCEFCRRQRTVPSKRKYPLPSTQQDRTHGKTPAHTIISLPPFTGQLVSIYDYWETKYFN